MGFSLSGLIKNAVSVASLAALGPAAGLLQSELFSGMAGKVIDQVLQKVGDALGLPQSIIDGAQGIAHAAMGDKEGAAQNFQEALDQLSPFDASRINQDIGKVSDKLSDGWMKLATQTETGMREGSSESRAKGKNFLEAIALALAAVTGEKAEKMMNSLDALKGADTKDSKAFTTAQTQFSADSQMFGMMSNMSNTVIKTLGEAMSTMARKG